MKGRTTEIVRTTVVCQIYDGAGYSRNQEFVPEGDKRVGSVTSGAHKAQSPRWDLGAKPPKHEKHAENLIECHKFHKKIFSVAISERADMSPLSPFLTPLILIWSKQIVFH